jgi:hypothetical protein
MENQPSLNGTEPEFPNGPAVHGNVYVMNTTFGHRICAMSEQTWMEFATQQEAYRQMLDKQDARIKELLAENAVSRQVACDAMTRLENIRHVRRAEMRERIEGQVEELVLPGDKKFTVPSKRKN